MTKNDLAAMIDHTILKANCLEQDIRKLCAEAKEYGFASVCVNPGFVKLSAQLLAGTNVKVCTVVGFPLGATSTEAKAFETEWSVANGAGEIDMVINISAAKDKDFAFVEDDIRAVVKAAAGKATVKVILECCYLNHDEIIDVCLAAEKADADYVKTSTGFGTSGALVEDVQLMKSTVPSLKVKAAGGIRDLKTALAMVEAGADRIGASAGIAILGEMD